MARGRSCGSRESHFYPYGLNYDSEVTNNSIYMRNIALMYAMRQDMGNGNPNNPWTASRVTLTGSDPAGTSAFNWFGGGYSGNYPGWSDKYFAHAGAWYSTGDYLIRTPVDTANPAAAHPQLHLCGGRPHHQQHQWRRWGAVVQRQGDKRRRHDPQSAAQ